MNNLIISNLALSFINLAYLDWLIW